MPKNAGGVGLSSIARLRLQSQRISAPTSATPAEVVSRLGAVQAQDYPGALWSIALRTTSATRAEVERAIAERTIVRSWPMRGTLHFIPAVDARWMLELLTPRIVRGMAGRHRQLGVDDDVVRRSRTLVARALKQRAVLPRNALLDALDKGGISPAGQRGIHIVRRLCMDRMLCFGPHDEKQPTFVLFDDWIPSSRQLDRQDALRTLAERFFTSHGPASVRDFVWWTGMTVADAKLGLRFAQPSLERVVTDDGELWMSNDSSAGAAPSSRAHLLPGFDELLLGYKDRSATLAPAYAGQICPGGNGVFQPTLVFDGWVCGLWRRSTRAKAVEIEAAPFVLLKAAQKKAFAGAAERYAEFLGMPVKVGWEA